MVATPARRPAETPPPRKRDPERTQRAIIEAARQGFSVHGYDGARTDRIAALTGMSKGVLYHYFNSKDDLFVAVLDDIYRELRAQNEALVLDDVEPEAGIRELIAHTYAYFAEHPEFIALVNAENRMKAIHLKASKSMRSMFAPLSTRLGELVARGQEQGLFRPDVDIVQLYVSIVGLGYFFLSNRWTLSVVFSRDLLAEGAEDERLGHISEVVLGYLRRPEPAGGRR